MTLLGRSILVKSRLILVGYRFSQDAYAIRAREALDEAITYRFGSSLAIWSLEQIIVPNLGLVSLRLKAIV